MAENSELKSNKSKLPFYKRPLILVITALCFIAAGTIITLVVSDVSGTKKAENYNSPSALTGAYKDAVINNNFEFMEKFQSPDKKSGNNSSDEKQFQDEIRKTLIISDVKITKKLELNNSAYYEFDINVSKSGASAYSAGKNFRCLFLKKASGKWYAEGLMSDNFPETEDQINLCKLTDSRMTEGG